MTFINIAVDKLRFNWVFNLFLRLFYNKSNLNESNLLKFENDLKFEKNELDNFLNYNKQPISTTSGGSSVSSSASSNTISNNNINSNITNTNKLSNNNNDYKDLLINPPKKFNDKNSFNG